MAQRQAAEPAVRRVDADVEAGADGAPEEVAVGESDRPRQSRAAAGEDPAQTSSMSCSPSSGRSASVWVSSPASSRSTVGSSAATIAARSVAVSRGLRGSRRGADLHQRVEEHHLLAARVHGQRRGRAAADAVGGEPARDPGRLRLELGVGDVDPVGRPARCGRGSSGIAVRASCRVSSLGVYQGSLAIVATAFLALRAPARPTPIWRRACPNATRTPHPSTISTRRSSGAATPSTTTSSTSRADGIAKITINRPEVRNAFRPQTLAELRDAFGRARDDTEVGAIVFTGAGDDGLLLRRRPADPRRRRLHR